MDLQSLISMMRDAGATRIYYKVLAANDNSKNQYYIGPSLDALNILPTGPASAEMGSHGRSILKASLNLSWLTDEGRPCRAPNARVVFYPQYPEVRLGSLSFGCPAAPKTLLADRLSGRVLVFGITRDQRILARLIAPDDPACTDLMSRGSVAIQGVFTEISLGDSPRTQLLKALREVAEREWIDSSRLDSQGHLIPCHGANCGGFTLEAALGVRPNSIAGPDFAGWEVKQHGVANLARPHSGTLTLMTPEPDGGWYRSQGVESFIRTFGYADTKGRTDRMNFGGHHSVGMLNKRTQLELVLQGFDSSSCRVTDAAGALALVDSSGTTAASWSFPKLLNHWRKKHARAVYVPSLMRQAEAVQYRYGFNACLGVGTSFELLLSAIHRGAVFYDPGLKLEGATSPQPTTKRRSQLRVTFRNLPDLYETFEYVDVRSA